MRRTIALLALIFTAFLVGGCGDQKRSDNQPHPLGAEWIDGKHHRSAEPQVYAEVFEDAEGCATCHEPRPGPKNLDCWDCHEEDRWDDWPAPDAQLSHQEQVRYCHNCHLPPDNAHEEFEEAGVWMDPESENFHGERAEQLFLKCSGCHGTEGQGLLGSPNCFDCHFPGWLPEGVDPEEHGEFHEENGFLSVDDPFFTRHAICFDCHQAVRDSGVEDPPKCTQCHDIQVDQPCASCHHPTPDTADSEEVLAWIEPSGHAAAFGNVDCSVCHDPSGWDQFVLERDPEGHCHYCHFESPHTEGWADPASENFHPPFAVANFLHCGGCHGTTGDGGAAGLDCFSCHFGEGWTYENHGDMHKAADGFDRTICVQCHEAARNTLVLSPPACSRCHD